MKSFFAVFITGIFLLSCASYKAQKQEALLTHSELGSLVQPKGDLFYSASESVGMPNWGNLNVTAQQLPFNRKSYAAYSKSIERAGTIKNVPFADSMAFKPKYVRLQLFDKLALVEKLNAPENRGSLAYLKTNPDIKMVSSVDVAPADEDIAILLNSEALFLVKDEQGNTQLKIVTEASENYYRLQDLGVFDYAHASFCWGFDTYGNAKVVQIMSGGKGCPKETEAKASKLKKERSYLKF